MNDTKNPAAWLDLLRDTPELYRQPGEVGLQIARVEGARLDATVLLVGGR